MKPIVPIVFACIVLLVITACSKTHTSRVCTDWVGDYSYNEDPVPTSTGINRIMQWDLSIAQQGDTCWGELEITGLRTYVKLLALVAGDSSHVDIIYNKYLDGDSEYRPGDVLFSLSKDNTNKLITTWHTLQPRLSEYAEEAGACFKPRKKKKGEEG